MHLSMKFSLMAAWRKDGDLYVAGVPALDIWAQGKTPGDAMRALKGCVIMYLKHCYRRKILDNALAARGFEDVPDEKIGPSDEYIDVKECDEKYPHTYTFEVPLHLIAQTVDNEPQRAAG